jgi:hypothetical protein
VKFLELLFYKKRATLALLKLSFYFAKVMLLASASQNKEK